MSANMIPILWEATWQTIYMVVVSGLIGTILGLPLGVFLATSKRGELLSPASTARLLSIMGNTKTGRNRLKGGLKPGWTLSHKTGTGQTLGPVQAGYNDIGVLTAGIESGLAELSARVGG